MSGDLLIRLGALGGGTPANPYRAPLPVARVVHMVGNKAVVAVPDTDVPAALANYHAASATSTVDGLVLQQITPDLLTEWAAHIDQRYPERAGQFRPQVV